MVRLCPGDGLTVDVEVFERAAADALRTGGITELQEQRLIVAGPLLQEDQYADWAGPGIDSMKPMPPW